MTVAIPLKTPIAEGDRQGADSGKRPLKVRRSGSEPHFQEISEESTKENGDTYRRYVSPNSSGEPSGLVPGGLGGKGG